MLVFIDESGDPGFKLNKGSSAVFVLAMVVFEDADSAITTQNQIKELQGTFRARPEWKFTKSSNDSRDGFFNGITNCKFSCRALVVRKDIIKSANLQSNPRKFYNYFTQLMCKHDGGLLSHAKIVIDGSGDRKFKQELAGYLRKELPQGTIKKLNFKDSSKDYLVQLADMCAGAIARSYSEKANSKKWRDILAKNGQIHDVWDFK